MAITMFLANVFGNFGAAMSSDEKYNREAKDYRFDALIEFFFMSITFFAFFAFLVFWAIMIVPVQYFLFLVCGAPARKMIHSKVRSISKLDFPFGVEIIEKGKPIPSGWWDSGFGEKPVTMTAAITGIVLYVLHILF
jgi:hypothetical protein